MQTGTVIAIIIAVLILLAIWWFMTRAGRARAAQRYQESRSADPALTDGASAAERGAPDRRSDAIVTESMGAGTVAAGPTGAAEATRIDEPAADAAVTGNNTFAGSQGSSLDGTAVATAAAAATGATAAALAGAATRTASHHETSAGADTGTGPAAHDEHGHPSATAPAPARATASPAGATGVVTATPAPTGTTGGAGTAPERARFDPGNDGHPLPGDDVGAGTSRSAAPDSRALPSAQPALMGDFARDSGDTLADVREMIKILNLRDSEAGRLELASEQFETLRRGERDGIDDARLNDVAERLRRMIR